MSEGRLIGGLLALLVGLFLLWGYLEERDEEECRRTGGRYECTTGTVLLNGKPAVMSSCRCER